MDLTVKIITFHLPCTSTITEQFNTRAFSVRLCPSTCWNWSILQTVHAQKLSSQKLHGPMDKTPNQQYTYILGPGQAVIWTTRRSFYPCVKHTLNQCYVHYSVLLSLLDPLKSQGYSTLRFNSRGVGKSTGWTSFTGFTEANDLEFLVQWAIDKLKNVQSLVLLVSPRGPILDAISLHYSQGYSHGSLIASLHPIIPSIKTSHVLISYPLGPRGWLTLFNSSTYTAKLKELLRTPDSNVLILYGTQDEFTGASKYNLWARELENESKGHFKSVEIADGSHFWRGQHGRQLKEAILEWLS